MDWMLLPLKRYADFRGRSRRLEFWLFTLAYFVAFAVLGAVSTTLVGIAVVGLFLPSLAVYVRRFHDLDMRGWWMLLSLVPLIGSLIVLVLMCLPGTAGPNRFGDDPLAPEDLGEVFA